MSNKNENHIDDLAKALLDQKTDAKLHHLENIEITTPKPEDVKRRIEENEIPSALERLRKERGQNEQPQETNIQAKKDDEEEIEEVVIVKAEEVQEEQVEQKEEPQPKKKKKRRFLSNYNKFRLGIVLVVLLAIVLLLCGYTYKVMIYDPAHNVSEQQQEYYDKFVEYADEWDMLSDSEKNELLDLQKQYKKLNDTQKVNINAYFKEQTGKKLTTIFKELKQQKENEQDEKNTTYLEIKNFMDNWDTYDDTTKANIVYYKDAFNGLNSYLQGKINDIAQEKESKSFLSIISTYEKKAEEEQKEAALESAGLSSEEAQSLLDEAQSDLETYEAYKEELEEQLQSAQQSGTDTSSIQSEIDSNNATISELNTRIEYYSGLLSTD